MIKKHPLRSIVRLAQQDVQEVCDQFADLLSQLEDPSYFTLAYQRQFLRILAGNLTETIEIRSTDFIRQAISDTIAHLEKQTGHVLGADILALEVRIEEQLRKRFAGLTLDERFKALDKMVTQNLLLAHGQVLSGLIAPEDAEVALRNVFNLKGTYSSAIGRANRLVISEVLRAYHYSAVEFAKWTSARTITVTIDPDKWEDESYRELAEGSPYEPNELPDYPRPMANYLLELSY